MNHATDMRARQLNIRLSDEEADRLDRVASHYGLNAAALIRMLVKREEGEIARQSTGLDRRQAIPIHEHDAELYERVLSAAHARYEREGWVWTQPNRDESTIDRTGLMVLRSGKYEQGRYRLRGDQLIRVSKKS